MVDFSFIPARFLGTDDADEVFAPPGEHNPIHLCVDPAESNKANLSVVFPVVDSLHNLVGKDFGSRQERDAVGRGWLWLSLRPTRILVPRVRPLLEIIHKCVHVNHSFFGP